MIDRNRKKINYHAESVDITYTNLGTALERMKYLVDTYGKDAYIDTYSEGYSETEYLYVYANREETDDEMNKRIAQEEKWEKAREEQELKDFERLKAKFGSK